MRSASHVLDGETIESITWSSVGADGGTTITAVLKCTQPSGGVPAKFPPIVCYLAEAATGLVLEASSGGVAAGSRGTVGTLLTDDSVFTVTVDDNGYADVVVTQTGDDSLWLIAINPATGAKIASDELDFDA